MNFSNTSTHRASTLTVGTTNSYTPSWPSTVNSGDTIILICFPDTSSDVVNVPSGYTLKSIASNSIKIMTKIAGSSEAAPTITSSSTVQHGCLVLRVENADPSSFVGAYGTGGGGSNWSTPAVVAPSADNLFFYGGLATGGTSDWLAGDEPTITTLIHQEAGASMWFGVGYDQLTASGSTGTRTPWENQVGSKVTFAFTIAPAAPSQTIDSYPSVVRSGQSGIAYSTSGLSSVTAISVGTLDAVSISDTAGTGTHALPALTDEVEHELYGTKTVTITGAEGSPTTTVDFQPPEGLEAVTLSGTLNTSETGGLHNMSPVPVVNDQIIAPPGLYDEQGNLTGEDGVYNCWHIQESTKIARSYTVTLGAPGNIEIKRGIVSYGIASFGIVKFGIGD